MSKLKEFIDCNGLKQVDVAKYLSIGESFVSQMVKGIRPLPKNLLKLLIENENGWDTSMLLDEPSIMTGNDSIVVAGNKTVGNIDARRYYSDSPDVLRAQIDMLDERIKEKDAQIKEKDAQIKEKDAQIKQLLDIIAQR